MYHDVLIATDGRPGTDAAVAHAIDLSQLSGSVVHILFVLDIHTQHPFLGDLERAERPDAAERRGRNTTAEIEESAADVGLETHREVIEGVPYRMILDYVRQNDIDLVVMGTGVRAGTERPSLGSTTERVLSLAVVPVLAVPSSAGGERPDSGLNDIVVPTDGSDVAERAGAHGLDVAERYGAQVHFVYVVDTTTYRLEDAPGSIVGLLEEAGQRADETKATAARARNILVETAVLRAVPEREILDFASAVDGDLIAIGTRGRAIGSRDRLLGSTTAQVIRRTDIPILTVS